METLYFFTLLILFVIWYRSPLFCNRILQNCNYTTHPSETLKERVTKFKLRSLNHPDNLFILWINLPCFAYSNNIARIAQYFDCWFSKTIRNNSISHSLCGYNRNHNFSDLCRLDRAQFTIWKRSPIEQLNWNLWIGHFFHSVSTFKHARCAGQ